MKHLFLILIKIYQIIPGPWHNSCRHIPTCSNYAKVSIERFGAYKGLKLTLKRLSKCTPWGTMGIDEVPRKDSI